MLAAHLGAATNSARINGMVKRADRKLHKYHRLVSNGEMYRFRLTKREEKEKYLANSRNCTTASPRYLLFRHSMSLSAGRCTDYLQWITRKIGIASSEGNWKRRMDWTTSTRKNFGDDQSNVARLQWSGAYTAGKEIITWVWKEIYYQKKNFLAEVLLAALYERPSNRSPRYRLAAKVPPQNIGS